MIVDTKIMYCENEDAYAVFALCEGSWYRASQWYNLPDSLANMTVREDDLEHFGWDKL